MLSGIFDNLQFWHWLVFGIILIILEIFSPAAFFMWMGAAAGVTGLALLLIPDLSWEIQFVIFSVASIISILLGRTFFNRKDINIDDPTISQIESELVGNIYQVDKAIQNGAGRITVGESTWKATGADCDVGTKVKVVAINGSVLEVVPV